jgi:hypothetical protein
MTTQDVFFDRMSELINSKLLDGGFDPEEIVVKMSEKFAHDFVRQSLDLGDTDIKATKKGWTRYCLTGERAGYVDFRFSVNKKLKGKSFTIRIR